MSYLNKYDKLYLEFLSERSGLHYEEIKSIILKYFGKGFDRKLNRNEFTDLYENLVLVNHVEADSLTDLTFAAFDENKDGLISLKEFLVNFFLSIDLA